MASVTAPRLFAAGTASASLLGDTYYAPGSTIGWALYSGRVAGRSAVSLPVEPTPDETLSASTPLVLFVVATTLLFLGITAHVAKLYKTHYVIMSTAVILVWAAAILAACASPRRQPAGQAHRATGWAVATLITLNAMLGSARSIYKPDFVLTGYLHRLLGLLTIVVIAIHLTLITNEFSVGPDATRLFAPAYETFAGAMAVLFVLLGVAVAWNLSNRALSIAPASTRETLFMYVTVNDRLVEDFTA
ncbi:MAG: hypothetical protein CL678_17630 [Bdellovibrionaceae bacterium]|nr:hypothetical protein [Pseudobdellovibrionaceae bacterium]